MSLSYLRDAITKRLQERVDAVAQAAIDMRVHPEMSSDQYALIQVDRLSEARALALAAKIVVEEYKRMTETPSKEEQTDQQQKKKAPVYG